MEEHKLKKRIISLLLCLCMVFSLLPTVVLAEGGDSTAPTIITMQYDDYADYGSDVTVAPDDTVLEVVDGKLHAKGIGSATFTAGGTEYSVTVEKAKLNIVLVAGQSNATGIHGSLDVPAITPDKGNSYWWDGSGLIDLSKKVTDQEQGESNKSVGWYPALAAEWHAWTGEKTVIIHDCYSGSSIKNWVTYDGNVQERTYNTAKKVQNCIKAINTNNFEIKHAGYYWLQGESDAFTNVGNGENDVYPTAEQYENAYRAMHREFTAALNEAGVGSYGAILSCRTRQSGYAAIEYCGMRVAQQDLANQHADIYMATVLTDDWHEAGNVSFTAASTKFDPLTYSKAEMGANSIHYNQSGYNVLGLDAADNMYAALFKTPSITDIELIGQNGYTKYQNGETIKVGGNMRIVGTLNTVDTNKAQIVARTLPISAASRGVTMTLTDASGRPVTDVMDSRGWIDTTKMPDEPLTLTVTADSIRKTYTLSKASGGTTPAPEPADSFYYNWDFTDDAQYGVNAGKVTLSSKADPNTLTYTENTATHDAAAGLSNNGGKYFSMEKAVTLSDTAEWTIEWRGVQTTGNNGLLLSNNSSDYDGDGGRTTPYLYLRNGGDGGAYDVSYCYGGPYGASGNKQFNLKETDFEKNLETAAWRLSCDGNHTLTLTNDKGYSATVTINGPVTYNGVLGRFGSRATLCYFGTIEYLKIYSANRAADAATQHDYFWKFTNAADDKLEAETSDRWSKNTLRFNGAMGDVTADGLKNSNRNGYFGMETAVVLPKNEPWTIEWQGRTTAQSVLLANNNETTDQNTPHKGGEYIYIFNDHRLDNPDDNGISLRISDTKPAATFNGIPTEIRESANTVWYLIHDGSGNLKLAANVDGKTFVMEAANKITQDYTFNGVLGYFTQDAPFDFDGTIKYLKIYHSAANITATEDAKLTMDTSAVRLTGYQADDPLDLTNLVVKYGTQELDHYSLTCTPAVLSEGKNIVHVEVRYMGKSVSQNLTVYTSINPFEITGTTLGNKNLYFLGDTVTVTVKCGDTAAAVNVTSTSPAFTQDGKPTKTTDTDGNAVYTFTFKVTEINGSGATVAFKAEAANAQTEAKGTAETGGIYVNLRNRIHLKLKNADGTEIKDATVIRRNNYWSDTYQPEPDQMTYIEADSEYRCHDWAVANDDNGTIIITLKDGRTATLTTDKNGRDIRTLLHTGKEEIYCEYTFPAYKVTGKMFFNGEPVLYDGRNQMTSTVSGNYGTAIPYTELESWAEDYVRNTLDVANGPTKAAVEIKKDGGTVALDEFKFGDAGKLQNYVYVNVKTYYTVTFMNGDEVFAENKDVLYGTATPVPTEDPTRAGYNFKGWAEVSGDAPAPVTDTVTRTVTYQAQWTPIKYRVIFDANTDNYTGTMESQVFTYDVEAVLRENAFVRTDEKDGVQLYVFDGWNTAADGTGDTYADKADFTNKSVKHGEQITLYAQWKHVTKSLTYVSEQGDAPDAANVDIFSEVVVAGAPADVDTTKYIFKGWRSNVAVGYEVMQPNDKFPMPATDVTLTAVWEEIVPAAKANLTYVDTVSDGAAGAVETEVGTWVTVKAAPAAVDGKTFKGWKSNIGGTVYQPGDKFQMPATDVTLTAVWEEIVPAVKHNVTYQYGIKTSVTTAPVEYEVGSIVRVMQKDPSETGYTFTGWRSSHEGRIYQRGDTFVMPDTDVTLTAQWQKNPTEYTVTFLDGDRTVYSTKGVAGSLVLLQDALKKEGYTFVGWKSNVDGKVYEASTRYTMPELNVKMTAVWKADPAKYTVTYALDGGEGTASDSNAYVEGAFVTVTDAAVTKDGFIFAGWRSNVGGTVYRTGDKFQMPASNVVLTAQWQPEEATYTVSTSVDGTVNAVANGLKANALYKIEAADPTKDGYTFAGWLLSSTGTIVHNGDTFNMPAGNVVLTAQWEQEAASYTVTYKNGESSESADSYKAGAWVTVKAAPTAVDGKTFKGWESNVGGTVYQPDTTFKMPDTNVILTAIWDSETYTITWKNGDAILSETTVKHGETPKYIGETPTKDATVDKTYTFKGWDPKITEATEDTTYTAQFDEAVRKYTIEFYSEGVLLASKEFEYGAEPVLGYVPTKAADNQYTYAFAGWTPDRTNVKCDAAYYATYTVTERTYTVTWKVEGQADIVENSYKYQDMPFYKGGTPAKVDTDDAAYEFTGWNPEISPIVRDVTYTAQFRTIGKYTVSYDLAGGDSIRPDDAKYAVGSVVKAADVPTRTDYVFDGWLISYERKTVNANGTFTMPATDVTLTAQWTPAVQVGDAYIVAADPKHAVHEAVYSDKLTAKKADATGAKITSGVKFVLVDDEGHALGKTDLGHGLTLHDDGTITGTAMGAGTLPFNVRLANLDNEFVSEARTITLVIEKAPRTCSVSIASWTYGDDPKTPVVTLSKTEEPETTTFYYKVKDADDSTYTTEIPVNAGDYTVKAVVGESANYLGCEAFTDFKILKKQLKSVALSVTAPVACAAAQTTIADGDGFTGTITWTPAPVDGKFDYATEYTATVVLTPDSNHFFTANTKAEGWSVSYDEASGKLTLTHKFEKTELGKIETPVIRPNGGRFTGRQTVKITCATEGAVIHYTTDGTTPTASSPVYDGVFTITETTTVKAIAVKEKYLDSEVASATFTKYTPRPSTGGTTVIPTPSKKDDSLRFDTEDHFAFVNGYPDGTVKPNGNVTRAEVAAILYRVMDADCVKTYETTRCSFSDVVRGDWFNLYVATLENAGVIVDTRTNGKFRPNEAITRAELAAMLAQFADTKSAPNYFTDVTANYWAANAIAVCAKLGWINGYPDGTFRPDQTVTRAEMMAMINRALERTPKSVSDLLSGMKTWSDNANTGAWYYLDVQEATNSHTYTKSGTHETWKKLR